MRGIVVVVVDMTVLLGRPAAAAEVARTHRRAALRAEARRRRRGRGSDDDDLHGRRLADDLPIHDPLAVGHDERVVRDRLRVVPAAPPARARVGVRARGVCVSVGVSMAAHAAHAAGVVTALGLVGLERQPDAVALVVQRRQAVDRGRHVSAHRLLELPRVREGKAAKDGKADKEDQEGDADFRSNIAVVNGQERDGKGCGTNDEPDGGEPRDGRRFLNDEVELLDVPEEHVSRDLAAQEDGVGLGAEQEKLLRSRSMRCVWAIVINGESAQSARFGIYRPEGPYVAGRARAK